MNQDSKKNSIQTHPIVTAVSIMESDGLLRQGDYIPHQLTERIGRQVRHRFGGPKFRLDRTARDVLAFILFWYRPGQHGGKKFRASLPQISRRQIAHHVGCSIATVSRKLALLEQLGLIRRVVEEKIIDTQDGRIFANVMYIELAADMLRDLLTPEPINLSIPSAQNELTLSSTCAEGVINLSRPSAQVDTATETLSETKQKETQTHTDIPPAAVTPSAYIVCDSSSMIGASPQTPCEQGRSPRLDNFLMGWCSAYQIQFSRKYKVTAQEKEIVQDWLDELEGDSVCELLWVGILSWNNEPDLSVGGYNPMFHCKFGRRLGTFVKYFAEIDQALNQEATKMKSAKGLLKQTFRELGKDWMNRVCPDNDDKIEGDGGTTSQESSEASTEAKDSRPGLSPTPKPVAAPQALVIDQIFESKVEDFKQATLTSEALPFWFEPVSLVGTLQDAWRRLDADARLRMTPPPAALRARLRALPDAEWFNKPQEQQEPAPTPSVDQTELDQRLAAGAARRLKKGMARIGMTDTSSQQPNLSDIRELRAARKGMVSLDG